MSEKRGRKKTQTHESVLAQRARYSHEQFLGQKKRWERVIRELGPARKELEYLQRYKLTLRKGIQDGVLTHGEARQLLRRELVLLHLFLQVEQYQSLHDYHAHQATHPQETGRKNPLWNDLVRLRRWEKETEKRLRNEKRFKAYTDHYLGAEK